MLVAHVVIVILLLLNAATFLAFRQDKAASQAGARRIPERHLLGLAFFGGSLGALCAQQVLRHKTRKQPFRAVLMAIAMVHILLAISFIAFASGSW